MDATQPFISDTQTVFVPFNIESCHFLYIFVGDFSLYFLIEVPFAKIFCDLESYYFLFLKQNDSNDDATSNHENLFRR